MATTGLELQVRITCIGYSAEGNRIQKALDIGQSDTVFVNARRLWNNTGIGLIQGATYSAIARGAWVDWTITCDADGYESGGNIILRLAERMRRAPAERWF